MLKLGFKQCKSDPCLYYRKTAKGIVIVLTYVDDNLCVGQREALEEFIGQFQAHGELEITVEEKLTDYLSCEICLSED